MVILDRLRTADIPYEALEHLIGAYMLVMNVEEDLTANGQDGLLIAFLKLQQDCGVQIDLTKTLRDENISLGGDEPPLRYGIDEGAVAPGEHTERTYTAYEAVTRERLALLLSRIEVTLNDRALATEFVGLMGEMGVPFLPPASVQAPPPPALGM
jgi:hypothetical protein